MQRLSWWVHCLLLRTVPQSLLPRQTSFPVAEPDMSLHVAGRPPSSFKACANGVFIVLGALMLGLFVILANFLVATWPGAASDHHWQRAFLEGVSNSSIRDHLRHLTKEPHVAGTPENFATADYIFRAFEDYGLAAHFVDYDVLLTHPLHRSLVLTEPGKEPLELSLTEKPVQEDPESSDPRVMPTFHAYSPSGNVSGEVVYVNYGSEDDFRKLAFLGISVEGAIVIARYGQIYRGDIVENAAKAGAVSAIVYSDPQDYGGNCTEGFYPESQWLPPSGAQRGSVFRGIGDPLTPGWPSTTMAERLAESDPETMLPRIPSLPISAEDARPILASLGGAVAPPEWHGALDLPEYKLGRGPAVLNLTFLANQMVAPIRNVLAVINGSEEPDRFVILGNHRDAWTFGAVDPNSGTASLLELARGLGKLVKDGWKPRRSILLCSWDAEEYGLVGSTEWVEQNLDILSTSAVAYLNVDCAVSGPGFGAAASPQLDGLLQEAAEQVKDPDSEDHTVLDAWVASGTGSTPSISRLGGGGSDYAPFLQHAGVPAMDLQFGESYPVYHSLYDNFNWMRKFGDPLFHRNVAVTSIWGLVTMRLANDPVLPLDYVAYATELQRYAKAVDMELVNAKAPEGITAAPLVSAIANLTGVVLSVKQELQDVVDAKAVAQQGSLVYLLLRRRTLNDRLLQAERAFLDSEGLTGKSWYKHLVYGPVSNNNYGSSSFPGILDAISEATRNGDKKQRWAAVQHEIWRASRVVTRVTLVLSGTLT